MPTATLTKTATHGRHYSIPLTGGVTPPNEPQLPLEPTGHLQKLPGGDVSTRLTPALGLQFDKRLQLRQVLALDSEERRQVMQDLAYESKCPTHDYIALVMTCARTYPRRPKYPPGLSSTISLWLAAYQRELHVSCDVIVWRSLPRPLLLRVERIMQCRAIHVDLRAGRASACGDGTVQHHRDSRS